MGKECAAEMGLSARMKAFGVSKALDYLERDPDANLPKLLDWMDTFGGERLDPAYRLVIERAMSDPDNNWYRLIKSMYSDIDNRVLKKIFENFIVHANIMDWPRRSAQGGWPEGEAPWSVFIDPTAPCRMDCRGCGATIYGVRPEMEFDGLDEAVEVRKARGTHLFIFVGGDPMGQEQGMIALCNKHTDCVFAVFTRPERITVEMAEDMLRVRNLFPAIQADEDPEGAEKAMALLRKRKLPFGVAYRCTGDNAEQAATEEFYDRAIGQGAKFCWFFTCPAFGDAPPATSAQLAGVHQRVRAMRRVKPLLSLDFWDKPSLSSVAQETVQEGSGI